MLPWLAFAFGLCIGSFLNVVIHRLPKMLEREWRAECAELARADGAAPAGQELPKEEPYNLVVPRSACPSCGHKITALENVPLVSWAFLRGKCSSCKAKISAKYPLVELLAGTFDARARVVPELLDRPIVHRDADDRAVEQLAHLQPVQGAERHDLRQVAREEAPVAKRGCRCLGVVEIAREDVRPADRDLADRLAVGGREDVAVVVEQAELDAVERLPDRARRCY